MNDELEGLLRKIREARDEYDMMYLKDLDGLSEVLRKITSALFYLKEYRVEAHERWLDVYNETKGTNAAKEREADSQVRELYMIRHTFRVAEKTTYNIGIQIGICRNQK